MYFYTGCTIFNVFMDAICNEVSFSPHYLVLEAETVCLTLHTNPIFACLASLTLDTNAFLMVDCPRRFHYMCHITDINFSLYYDCYCLPLL